MLTFTVDVDTASYRAALAGWHPVMSTLLTDVVHETAGLMAAAMQSHATGRPGPRVQTGNLRSSILVDHEIADVEGFGAATVYTDVIYARRLEYGFYGADSLGRVRNDPPYPFWGPGFNQIAPTFEGRVRDVLRTL